VVGLALLLSVGDADGDGRMVPVDVCSVALCCDEWALESCRVGSCLE
jgi:hypothetical protein